MPGHRQYLYHSSVSVMSVFKENIVVLSKVFMPVVVLESIYLSISYKIWPTLCENPSKGMFTRNLDSSGKFQIGLHVEFAMKKHAFRRRCAKISDGSAMVLDAD